MQDGGDHGALVAGEEEPGQVAEEEHGDGADEDHRAGQAALRLLGVVRRRRHLARHLLQEVEPPPDGKVEEGEHDERQEAGQAHPSPGGIEEDVVAAKTKGSRTNYLFCCATTATMGEVDTIFDRLSFEELWYVDDDGEKEAGENVEQRSVLLLLQSVVRFCDCQEALD